MQLLTTRELPYILAELSADGSDLLVQSSREHHDLLLVRSSLEDRLHILSHAQLHQHAVALIQHEVLHVRQVQSLAGGGQIHHTTRSAHNDVRHLNLQSLQVGLDIHTFTVTEEEGHS